MYDSIYRNLHLKCKISSYLEIEALEIKYIMKKVLKRSVLGLLSWGCPRTGLKEKCAVFYRVSGGRNVLVGSKFSKLDALIW